MKKYKTKEIEIKENEPLVYDTSTTAYELTVENLENIKRLDNNKVDKGDIPGGESDNIIISNPIVESPTQTGAKQDIVNIENVDWNDLQDIDIVANTNKVGYLNAFGNEYDSEAVPLDKTVNVEQNQKISFSLGNTEVISIRDQNILIDKDIDMNNKKIKKLPTATVLGNPVEYIQWDNRNILLENKTQKLDSNGNIYSISDIIYNSDNSNGNHTFNINSIAKLDIGSSFTNNFNTLSMNNNRIVTLAPAVGDSGAVEYKQWNDRATLLENASNKIVWEGNLTGTTPIVLAKSLFNIAQKYTISFRTVNVNQSLQMWADTYKLSREDANNTVATNSWRDIFAKLTLDEYATHSFIRTFDDTVVCTVERPNFAVSTGVMWRNTLRIDVGNDLQIRSSSAASTDYIIIREV